MKKIICAAVFAAAAILAHNPASAFSAGSLTATAIGTSGGMIEQVQGRRFGRPAVVVRPGVGRAVVVRPGLAARSRFGPDLDMSIAPGAGATGARVSAGP